jgi:imidazolonepropionase-like amidohydrolase
MITSTLILGALAAFAPDDKTELPPVYALRVGRAETVANGAVEHAVVLVENGKITVVGEDLPVERGIPTFDHPDWVLMPGLVNCKSRAGLSGRAGNDSKPEVKASDELYPQTSTYTALVEAGVTTLGLHPAGEGIPGQAVAVRPSGSSSEEVILRDPAYLLIELRSNVKSKRMVMDAFGEADEYGEKVEKAREKWEKDLEKQKKAEKKKKDDDKKDEDEKEEEKVPETFTPPEPDADVKPFLDLRAGKLTALVDISKAADYLHLLDALGDEEIGYSLFCNLRDDIDLYEVSERIGETGVRIVLSPEITLQPFTRRDRNLPAEFAAAGAKLAFVPRSDTTTSHRTWLVDAGNLVRFGLDREDALRALTLEPAEVLGVADRVGSIEAGKDANLILLDGDPFEPATRIQMVILEGENVYEYEAPTTGGDEE